jgi:hypothetical protein
MAFGDGVLSSAAIPRALCVELAPKQLDDGPHIHEVNVQVVKFLGRICEG